MSGIFDDTNRQPIPRCVEYLTACALGILRSIRAQEKDSRTAVESFSAREEWQNNPTLDTAVDLVAEAIILKNFDSEEATKAAQYILKKARKSLPLIRELANHFLEQPSSGTIDLSPTMQIEVVREHIARLKKTVRLYPLNPLAWSDLSLRYATLGQVDKAQSAMEVALGLGKNNRFILRSAARCFLHVGQPDRAVAILDRSGLTSVDPWIASAEIAISESSDLKSKCVNKARHLIQDDHLTFFSRSELATGLGTLEIKNGAGKRARNLMRQALRDPTENALAQAQWMATRLQAEIADMADLARLEDRVPASYEAQARHFYYNKRFADSLRASEMWGRFQPLSSGPVMLSSFVASVCLNDDTEALRILRNANPALRNDPLFINNYAFSLARSDDLAAALSELRKVDLRALPIRPRLILTATHGLIAFRKSDVEQGRNLYSNALTGFDQINDQRSAAFAAYFWALEEKAAGSPDAAGARGKDAKRRIKRFHVFDLEHLAERL